MSRQPTVDSVEKTAVSIATPYINILSEAAPKALHAADTQVAQAVDYLSNTENAKAFLSARDQYLKYVEDSIEKVKSQSKLDDRLAGLVTSLQAAVANVRQTSWGTYAASMEKLQASWNAFIADPRAKAVLGRTQDASDALLASVKEAHTRITADSRYALLFAKGCDLLQWVQQTAPYRAVQPLLQPVVNKVASTDAYKQTAAAVKPTTQPAPASMGPTVS